MYGEMAYHVIKKKRNTDDSSWQDIYIQRGRDAEHPYAIGGRYSFRRLLRRHLFERNAQGGTLKPAHIGLHQRGVVFSRQTSLAKKGRANRVELWTLLMTSSRSIYIVLPSCLPPSCKLSNQIVEKKPHPPNQQQHDQHLIFVP